MYFYTKKKTLRLINCNYLIINISFYSTNNNNTKHYVPGNKEWKDSVYSYNKNYLKNLPFYNNTSNSLLSSHFNLTNLKNIARSKRMRSLIMKKSSRKIFLSRPYIKHTNDKNIINIYTFNRQKEFLMRKLYFYKRKYNLFRQWINNPIVKKIKVNKNMLKNSLKKKLFHYIIIKRKNLFNKRTKKRIPYHGINYKNELDYIKYKTSNILLKLSYFNNLFIFMFYRKLLYLFDINLFVPILSNHSKNNKIYIKNNINTNNRKISKNLNRDIFVKTFLKKILSNKPNKVMWLDKKTNLLNLSNKSFLNIKLIKIILFKYRYNYVDLMLLNKRILYYIENKFIKTGIINKSDILNLYIKFKIKYYRKLVFKFFTKKSAIFYYLNSLELNILKFTKLLLNLKILIARIYNKKVELNITNLKYPFLNSEIYTKVMIYISEKKLNIMNILGISLGLSKMPKEILNKQLQNLNPTKFNKLSLNDTLEYMYATNFINKKSVKNKYLNNGFNKVIDVLNTIKFKWVAGVWLQGAGRLTRRYTASRSALTIKHKGSLKNEEYYVKDGKLKPASKIVIRNTQKSNSQYTSIGSKRRIGSFGIKSWISSY